MKINQRRGLKLQKVLMNGILDKTILNARSLIHMIGGQDNFYLAKLIEVRPMGFSCTSVAFLMI